MSGPSREIGPRGSVVGLSDVGPGAFSKSRARGVEVYSVEEAGDRLGCSRRRVFQLLADGVLARAPRYGKRLRILADSVDQALAPKAPKAKRRARKAPPVSLVDIRPELLG